MKKERRLQETILTLAATYPNTSVMILLLLLNEKASTPPKSATTKTNIKKEGLSLTK